MEATKTLTPEATRLLERAEKKIERLNEEMRSAKDKIEANGMSYCLEWGVVEAIVKTEIMVGQLQHIVNVLDGSKAPYNEIVGYCKNVATEKVMSRAWASSSSLGHNLTHLIRHDAAVEFLKWLDENS